MEDFPTALVIGDPHFRETNLAETRIMARRCIKLAKDKNPTFIVVLGDTLHRHGEARIGPFKEAFYFIESLAEVAPVYILIGNHDLINAEQFLTDNHFFLPYRKWTNVAVIDRPRMVEYGDYSFVMCPYTPPGRFEEALNSLLKEGADWQLVDCIFAHQEFKGCSEGRTTSKKGDVWNKDYPPVISGHIHDSQTVGNVFYTGSPIQHTFGEKPGKCVWFVSFGEEDPPYFIVEKLDLGMRQRKDVHVTLSEAEKFDVKETDHWILRLILTCSSTEFRAFRQSLAYQKLTKEGVKIKYNVQPSEECLGTLKSREEVSYQSVLKEVVKTKSEEVRNEYVSLLGDL